MLAFFYIFFMFPLFISSFSTESDSELMTHTHTHTQSGASFSADMSQPRADPHVSDLPRRLPTHSNILEVEEASNLKKARGKRQNQQGSTRSPIASTRPSKIPRSIESQAGMRANVESAISSPVVVQDSANLSSEFSLKNAGMNK